MMLTASRPTMRRFPAIVNRPNPMRTLEEFERFCHVDIPSLSDYEVAREYRLLIGAVDRASRPCWWQRQRIDLLRAEIARRRAERRRA